MAATHALRLVPEPGVTQQRITSSVAALADILGIRHADLAAQAHIGADKLSKSLSMKRKLTLDETERLADALRVPVSVLYDGGDELRRRARAGVLAPPPAPTDPDGLEITPRAWNGDNVLDFRARRIGRPAALENAA